MKLSLLDVHLKNNMIADLLKIPGQKKVPLVIGGIGTESAIPYMRSLLRLNKGAKRDQDHLGYLMLVASSIPDRTEAILKREKGDKSQYQEIANKLIEISEFGEKEGFTFMVAICNTIHTWREDKELNLQSKLKLPWISIMEATAEDLKEKYKPGTKIAIFATTGTLMSKLYHNALEKVGLVPVSPETNSELQINIMKAIYDPGIGIKAKGATKEAISILLQAPTWAEQQQCEVALAGCTEIPLGLNNETYHGNVAILNPLDSLAKKTLALSFAR